MSGLSIEIDDNTKPKPYDYVNDSEMITIIKSYFNYEKIFIENENIQINIQTYALQIYEILKKQDSEIFDINSSIRTSVPEPSDSQDSYTTTESIYDNNNDNDNLKIIGPKDNQIQEIYTDIGMLHKQKYQINQNYFIADKSKKFFYKKFIFKNDTYAMYGILSILREIVLHKYALYLQNELSKSELCKSEIYIPSIHNFSSNLSKFTNEKPNLNPKNIEIIIQYEFIDIIFPFTINNDTVYDKTIQTAFYNTYRKIAIKNFTEYNTQIHNLFKCFEENHLFHNDSHIDNLCLIRNKKGGIQLALFDFGKATLNHPVVPSSLGYPKNIENNSAEELKLYEKWLNKNPVDQNYVQTYGGKTYGGKNRRQKNKTKTHKKSKRKQNKKRKQTRKKENAIKPYPFPIK
jgi:hypothetical protein